MKVQEKGNPLNQEKEEAKPEGLIKHHYCEEK